MRCGTLRHGSRTVVGQVWRAERWWQRLRGLLGRGPLQPGQGLLIVPCASVHTFGMRQSLDLVFLDRGGRVLGCRQRLRPWRAAGCAGAHATLELRAGTLPSLALEVGQVLEWHDGARRQADVTPAGEEVA